MGRRFGQHFLTRPSILEQIADASAPSPVPESVAHTATDSPTTNSTTESVTDSQTESVTNSITESAANSATESATKSVTDPPTKSATNSTTESATNSTTVSAANSATEPVTEPRASASGPHLVIEIGPGKGALTQPLLERAAKVIAIEVDPVLVHYLRQKFRDAVDAGRLELIEGDVLKTDLSKWGPAVIAGNLPYYITSPILERVFNLQAIWVRAVFLVQAEVAARIAASPGSRDYGYLSVLTQVYSRPELLLAVPRGAFRPPPKVDSAVVRLEPRDAMVDWNIADRDAFLRFASACFRQKRKTLRNNLAPMYGKERMDAMPEGRLRAEQLSVPELADLFRKLEAA